MALGRYSLLGYFDPYIGMGQQPILCRDAIQPWGASSENSRSLAQQRAVLFGVGIALLYFRKRLA